MCSLLLSNACIAHQLYVLKFKQQHFILRGLHIIWGSSAYLSWSCLFISTCAGDHWFLLGLAGFSVSCVPRILPGDMAREAVSFLWLCHGQRERAETPEWSFWKARLRVPCFPFTHIFMVEESLTAKPKVKRWKNTQRPGCGCMYCEKSTTRC